MANKNAPLHAEFPSGAGHVTVRNVSRRFTLTALSPGSFGMPSVSEEYRQHAAECLRIAQDTRDPSQRARLLQMAEAWKNLADEQLKREGNKF